MLEKGIYTFDLNKDHKFMWSTKNAFYFVSSYLSKPVHILVLFRNYSLKKKECRLRMLFILSYLFALSALEKKEYMFFFEIGTYAILLN